MAEHDQSRPAAEGGKAKLPPPVDEAEARRLRAVAIANIIRVFRRPNGLPLTDVAIVHRVRGSSLAEVRAVRAELDGQGYSAAELAGPASPPGEGGAG